MMPDGDEKDSDVPGAVKGAGQLSSVEIIQQKRYHQALRRFVHVFVTGKKKSSY
jgi:hypothetical protein